MNLGRLLSYEGPHQVIAAVDCRELLLDGGRKIQVVISREADADLRRDEDGAQVR